MSGEATRRFPGNIGRSARGYRRLIPGVLGVRLSRECVFYSAMLSRNPMSVELLIADLADRKTSRSEATLQADIRQLLIEGNFDLGDAQVVLEARAGERKRIDIEVGATVIEVKRDLTVGNVLTEAVKQLAGYVRQRQESVARRYVGILTDGKDWRCYHLRGEVLEQVSRCEADPSKPQGLLVWLDGVLATLHGIKPTPDAVRERLGANSSAYELDRATLEALYAANAKDPGVRIKRRLWARLLESALGTQFQDDDALFIEHTLLVNTAEIVAHAVLGLPLDEIAPRTLLSGAKLDEAGIHGVVEADFFDWVVESKDGERFVSALAHRLARFEWNSVEHDVLKVLYESVIGADTRKKLGEYYTPDWLAQRVVDEVVTDPLAQRVLDPSCGSGTFLFHAVRRYLDAAAAKKIPLGKMLEGVTQNVVGMDLHPVAVTLARVTYILAIGLDRLRDGDRGVIHVPVYLGDTMQWHRKDPGLFAAGKLTITVDDKKELFASEFEFPASLLLNARRFDALVKDLSDRASERARNSAVPKLNAVFARHAVAEADRDTIAKTFATMCRLHDENRDHIWGYYIRNLARPEWLCRDENRADVLVGNPPWLAYRYMPETMKADFRSMSESRGLWQGGKVATNQDLSALFVARAAQLYLKEGGALGFVMPNAVLDRSAYKGFRAGDFADPLEHCRLAFSTPWNLKKVRPHFFPYAAGVVFARRTQKPSPMPEAELWTAKLKEGNAMWAAVAGQFTRSSVAVAPVAGARSPYHSRFRQGATIVPRMLFMVERRAAGPLGLPTGKLSVRSARSANEKMPWKDLAPLEGVIESEFVRPVHLGETVLPYRVLAPEYAVIPRDADGLLDPNGDRVQHYPGLAKWWSDANAVWLENRSSERLTLTEQLDYQGKLKSQFPPAEQRVVYTKAGMHLAAARLVDHRAVIDHKLYWASVSSIAEANYLCAVMNAAVTTTAVRPLMSYGKDERDIDKYVWQLRIPEFDPSNTLHAELADLGAAAEAEVARLKLNSKLHFAAQRRAIRGLLEVTPVGRKIEARVAELLGVEHTPAPETLDAVYALVEGTEMRQAVAKVFADLDGLMLSGHMAECDAVLAAVDVERLDITTALAFLAITLQAREQLSHRAALVGRVESWLRQRDPARAERLMEGLR
jgi:hypothetical protein